MTTRIAALATLALLVGCSEGAFSYALNADVVLPETTSAELTYPALVQIEWLDEVHNLALLCEAPGEDLRYAFEDGVVTDGHVSHHLVLARVVPFTADVPCDPEMDLEPYTGIGTGGAWEIPYDRATVFPDEVSPIGTRDHEQEDAAVLVLEFQSENAD